MNENFQLTKYYLDCVSQDLSVVILYSARLKWKIFNLGFMNIFHKSIDDKSYQSSYFKNHSFPEIDSKSLTWNNDYIHLNSKWQFKSSPIIADLSPEKDGSVLWECLSPNANGVVKFDNNQMVTGNGYVERIKMTQLPWKLGFDKLYWGRFISENHYIVWIIWEGKNELVKVIHNGTEYNHVKIDDNKLEFNGLCLNFENKFIIRDSFILDGILSNIPFIDKLKLTNVTKIHENKVFCKANIVIDNEIISGNVISEVVKWT